MLYTFYKIIFCFISREAQTFYGIVLSIPMLFMFTKKTYFYINLVNNIFIFVGFNEQGLSNISKNQYNNELSKNGLYSLFSAFRHNTLDYDKFYKTLDNKIVMARAKELFGFNDKTSKFIDKDGKVIKPNIMFIMVESLSTEYMVSAEYKGSTPNLDKLIEKSLYFNNVYATGTRTVRGMEAVALSIPPTPGRSIVKRPNNSNLFSAGFIFKEKGYDNKFLYHC
jgi:hypothetical protein